MRKFSDSLLAAVMGYVIGCHGHRVTSNVNTPGAPSEATVAERINLLPTPAPQTQAEPFHWRVLESTNYHTYVKNLRSIGCPESTIRDIIQADVHQTYAQLALVTSDSHQKETLRREELWSITKILGLGSQAVAALNREWSEVSPEQSDLSANENSRLPPDEGGDSPDERFLISEPDVFERILMLADGDSGSRTLLIGPAGEAARGADDVE